MSSSVQDHLPPGTLPRRPYRSKRNRPCTFCRIRKTSCRRAENDASCITCRRRGQHCSFLDDAPQDGGLTSSSIPAVSTRGTINDAGASTDDILGVESSGDFMGLTIEERRGTDPDLDCLDPDLMHDGFGSRHEADMHPLCEGLSDPSIWMGPAPGPANELEMSTALDNELFDFDGILSTTAQPSRPTIRDETDPSIRPAHLASHSPDSLRHGEAEFHGSSRVISSFAEDHMDGNTTSIDQRPGFHGTYFGLSGESDPYLLRHYLYNEADEFPFLRVVYRRTHRGMHNTLEQAHGYTPNPESRPEIPVQFLLTANELGEEHKKAGHTNQLCDNNAVISELHNLVNDEHGRRLILLFIQYVFPGLPVISRSQLTQGIAAQRESFSSAESPIPAYLLAAIYASALPFTSYDDILCVSNVYKKPSAERLWQIVYEGVQSDMHTPRLATISSALLFLNRPRVGVQHVSADTSFTWSFAASVIGLVTSLGLHLDCQAWSIPSWERRLRRRLWWMSFSEVTWRSLLLGQPSAISPDQWSVSPLTRVDFDLDDITVKDGELPAIRGFITRLQSLKCGPEEGLISQHLSALACIADKVQRGLYTIRATEKLAHNLGESVKAIKPLREELGQWYAELPMPLKSPKTEPERSAPIMPSSAACLRFAYLTLEVLLYRALLRPLAAVDLEDKPGLHGVERSDLASSGGFWGQTQDIGSGPGQTGIEQQHNGFQEQAELIISAAENCATIVTNFTVGLMSWDFAGFWYSWSRIGWATTSSFLAILLVQSPSVEHARTCKALIDRWRQILRHQSQSFEDMSLGILRLDAMYWSNMNKIFRVNDHLRQVIHESRERQ